MRSRHIKRSDEERAVFKMKMVANRAKLTIAHQLGYYIGEEIVNRYLPTLSVDMLQTTKNISVTCAEGDECRRLNDIWFSKYLSSRNEGNVVSEKEWNALRAYHEMLETKYLPKTVECRFRLLNILEKDMVEFKNGVSESLWNCDCSHYSTDVNDIDVKADDDGWFTVITLKRCRIQEK